MNANIIQLGKKKSYVLPVQVTLSLASTAPISHWQTGRLVSGSLLQLSEWQWLQLR